MNNQDRLDANARTAAPIFFDMTISTLLSMKEASIIALQLPRDLIKIRDKVSHLVCNQQDEKWGENILKAYEDTLERIAMACTVMSGNVPLYMEYTHQYDSLKAAQNGFKKLLRN